MESLIEQFYNLLFAIFIGILAAYCYDIYSLVRQKFRFKRLALILGDLAFWLVMIVVVYTLLLVGNRGEVRFYHLIGMVLGAALYTSWLSRRAMIVTLKVVRPFVFLYRLLFKNRYAKGLGSGIKTLLNRLLGRLGIK